MCVPTSNIVAAIIKDVDLDFDGDARTITAIQFSCIERSTPSLKFLEKQIERA